MDTPSRRPDATGLETNTGSHAAQEHECLPMTEGAAWWQPAWRTVTHRPERAVGVLLLIGLLIYLAGLGQRTLWAPDEGRYAEIPREMVASGDWLTPRLNGAKYFEKPPLHYWLVAAAFRLLGENELAARLPCALAAVGGLLLVYGFGAACFGAGTGMLAALMLAVSPLYFILGRMDIIDTPLMLFYTLGMVAWGLALLQPERARRSASLALAGWAGLALATLVKGPVALALPVGTVVLWLMLTRQWDRWRALRPLPGLALYLVIAAPWFVAVSLKNPEFAWFFFIHEHVLRFLTTEHERKGPVYYYVPVILLGFFPWSAWLPAAVLSVIRSVRGPRQPAPDAALPDTHHSREAGLWLLLWAAVPFVFFSASGSKLITYILPAFPALALLVAAWWPVRQDTQESGASSAKLHLEEQAGQAQEAPRITHHARDAALRRGAVGAAIGAALLAVVFPLLPRLAARDTAPGVEPWLALASAALVTVVVLAPIFARRREPAVVLVTLMGAALVTAMAVDRVELAVDAVRGMRHLAEPVRARPDARLVAVDTYDQAFNFYSRHRAILVGGVGELAFGRDHAPDRAEYFRDEGALPALLAEGTPTFFLIHRKGWDSLKPLFEGRARVVAEGRKHMLLLTPGDENAAAAR